MSHNKILLNLLISFFCVFTVSSCGETPKPFKHVGRAAFSNPLVEYHEASGVIIYPLDGLPTEDSHLIAEKTADLLMNRYEMIASKDLKPNGVSYTVQGVALPLSKTNCQYLFNWKIYSPEGRYLTAKRSIVSLGNVSEKLRIQGLATAAAGFIYSQFHNAGSQSSDFAAAGNVSNEILLNVNGIDEQKQTALLSFMKSYIEPRGYVLLKNADYLIAAENKKAFQLVCNIKTEELQFSELNLKLDWRVYDSDGKFIGSAEQKNIINSQEFKDSWHTLARAIASESSNAVAEIITKYKDNS